MTLFWDIDGNKISDVLGWACRFEDNSYRLIAAIEWPQSRLRVSSVWMGYNSSVYLGRTDEPTSIFSTAILDMQGIIIERHAPTKQAALADFDELMAQAREML